MIVASVEVKVKQTRTKIDILKSTTLLLWLKIKKEDKKSYKSKISIHIKDNFFSKETQSQLKNRPKQHCLLTNSIAYTRSHNKSQNQTF